MTTKELFESEINKQWNRLKERDDTIFENITVLPNFDKEFEKFKTSPYYMSVLNENSVYEKKKLLEIYFWSDIVGELYEHTVGVMEKAGVLEESTSSFENSYKIETTARLVLEKGVFAGFPEAKELVENQINLFFYPELIEEGFFQQAGDNFKRALSAIVKSSKMALALGQLLFYFTVSPGLLGTMPTIKKSSGGIQTPVERKHFQVFTRLVQTATVVAAYAAMGIPGVGASLVLLGTPGLIWSFFNKDLVKMTKYLQKINTADNDVINGVLKDMGVKRKELVKKCWERNNHQFDSKDIEAKNLFETLAKTFTSEGQNIQNLIRDPLFSNVEQMAVALKKDALNPKYQKMFYDFRVCLYDKIFEIVVGYAQAIYSVDDASYEIIRYANDVHKRKNFKAFFKLDPKTDSEIAMFNLIKILISIEDMVINLDKNKSDLVADKYIDQFINTIQQNIKLTYTQLDELAQQRSYNKARYDEMNPTDEEKAEAIAKEREEAKRSIFS